MSDYEQEQEYIINMLQGRLSDAECKLNDLEVKLQKLADAHLDLMSRITVANEHLISSMKSDIELIGIVTNHSDELKALKQRLDNRQILRCEPGGKL